MRAAIAVTIAAFAWKNVFEGSIALAVFEFALVLLLALVQSVRIVKK